MSSKRRRNERRSPQGRAQVVFAGSPNHDHSATVAPPDLRPGQVRCPVCRNGALPTLGGNLRRHSDLFGHPCYNRATGEPTGIETPDVVLPAPRVQPTPQPVARTPREQSTDGRLQPPTGLCHECDRPVTGERRFCGPCLARRSR